MIYQNYDYKIFFFNMMLGLIKLSSYVHFKIDWK
jgi:hypothetical protein